MQNQKIGKVVLIDDEKLDRIMYSRVLERTGLVENVITFEYADTALDELKLSAGKLLPIDVIFLDINMPRMNGFEFLDAAIEQLGKDFVNIVVIMLTTSMDSRDIERANEFEMVKRYIQKPLTASHVQEVQEMLLAG